MADKTVTAANVLASAFAKRFIPTPAYVYLGMPTVPYPAVCKAGATLTAGVPVYQGTDDLFYPADANGADPLYKVVGIAENGASVGQPVSIVTEDPFFTPGFTMLVGDVYILSGNVGLIAPVGDLVAGWRASTLLVAHTTTQAELKITRADQAKA